MFGYCGEESIRIYVINRDVTIVDVNTGGVFRKSPGGTVLAMHMHGGVIGRVHGYIAELAYLG